MAAWQPFLIADFKTGRDISKEVWLTPQDSFPTLSNARVRKGVIEKRKGYTLLDSTGASLPIMGIFEARYKGVPRVLVLDTKRIYSYDVFAGTLTDLSLANTFTGTNADFFRFCTYYSKTYMVNGIDGIRSWDDSTDTIATVSTAGAVTVTTCDALFMLKSRLHLVAPTIGGVYYPDRIYYTDVGLTTITNATQYYIYERDDVHVTNYQIDMNNQLIMGRKSSWKAEYTGDSSNPFRCTSVDTQHGSMTPFAIVEYKSPTIGRLVATLDRQGIIGFDGYQFRIVDWPLRDLTESMAAQYLRYCQATTLTERDAVYMTYPSTGQTLPDKMLEYGINENNWSEHSIVMHCLGSVSGEVDPSNYSYASNYVGRAAIGYILAGDATGNLYRLDYGDDDNGTDIAFEANSAAMNPFMAERRKAYLGWIDIYCDNDSTASYSVALYKDDGTTAYKTIDVSCDGEGDRFWQRINVGGEVANFHRMKFYNSGSANRPRIHAICPWFRPGGLMATTSDASAGPTQTWRLHYESGSVYIQRKESGSWVNYQTWGA